VRAGAADLERLGRSIIIVRRADCQFSPFRFSSPIFRWKYPRCLRTDIDAVDANRYTLVGKRPANVAAIESSFS
jgi:hypothetical protein